MQNPNSKMSERFDEKFGKEMLHEQDGTEYDFKEDELFEDIKSFIQSEIDLAVAERNENLVERIQKPLENAFYECNLEPEEAEQEAKKIINLISKTND